MDIDRALRQILIVGLCLVPIIPLFVADGLFFPFITGKNFAFRILVELLFAVWLILALRNPEYRPRFKGTSGWLLLPIAMIGLLVSAGVSTMLAENPHKAFWSNFERMEGWIGLLHSTIYFFILWLTFQSEKLWSRFWNTSIAVSVVMGFYCLMQLGGMLEIHQGGVRVDGTLGNATYLAVYMLFHVFITLFYLVKKWRSSMIFRLYYGGALLLQTVILLYTATRGTILGLAGGLFLLALSLLIFGKAGVGLKKWAAGVLIALIAISGLIFLVRDVPSVRNHEIIGRIAGITLDEGKTRFTLWGMAFEGFKERPIFGWGQEGFNYVFNEQYRPSLYAQEPWFDRAHNAFIDWLMAGGIIAFALYISFYALPLWYLWRPGSDFTVFEKSLFTGLLAAYAFHNLFVFDNLISYVFFMSVLAYLLKRHEGESSEKPRGTPLSPAVLPVVSSVVIIVMLVAVYFANVPGIATASNLIHGLSPQCVSSAGAPVPCTTQGAVRDISLNFKYMQDAVTDGLGKQEVAEQMVQFATQVRQLNAGDATFQQQVLQFAASTMQKQLNTTPNDARLQLFMGSFLRQLGNAEEALPHIKRAFELAPRKQQIIFELAVLENDRGNYEAALQWFKEAYELDTSYDTARTFYAATALRAGKVDLAQSLLVERFGTATPDDDNILQAYLDIKEYTKALAIAEGRVAKDPNNAQLHVQLAAAYLAAERRSDAIAELERAIVLEPSFKEQGTYYIEEIRAGRNP